MVEAVSPIMSQAEVLSKSSHRQLKGKSFVLEHKDATALVKVEIGEIRRLVQAFAIADGHQDNSSDNSASQEEEKAWGSNLLKITFYQFLAVCYVIYLNFF